MYVWLSRKTQSGRRRPSKRQDGRRRPVEKRQEGEGRRRPVEKFSLVDIDQLKTSGWSTSTSRKPQWSMSTSRKSQWLAVGGQRCRLQADVFITPHKIHLRLLLLFNCYCYSIYLLGSNKFCLSKLFEFE